MCTFWEIHHFASIKYLLNKCRNLTGKYEYSFFRKHRKAVSFCQSFTWSPLTTGTCSGAPSIPFWGPISSPERLQPTYGAAAGTLTRLHGLEEDRGLWLQRSNLPVTADRAAGMLVTRRQKVLRSSHLSLSIHVFSCSLFFPLPSFSAFSELEPECIRLWRTLLLPNFRHGVRDSALYSVPINSAEPQQALWMYVTTHLKF